MFQTPRTMAPGTFSEILLLSICRLSSQIGPARHRILMFHGFEEKSDKPSNPKQNHIPVDRFALLMEFLSRSGRVRRLAEVVDNPAAMRGNAVSLTFDDGYLSNATLAWPVLRRLNLPATIFLATRFIEERAPLWTDRLEHAVPNRHALGPLKKSFKHSMQDDLISRVEALERENGRSLPALPDAEWPPTALPMTPSHIRAISAERLLEFGAHTHDHLILSRCSEERMHKEIVLSRDKTSSWTGQPCELFAYPNGADGDFNSETETALRAHGFRCALTTVEGANRWDASLFRLKRIAVGAAFTVAKLTAALLRP